ncbi:hypothetical protein GCM10009616_21170 [Microlunatus lacustris]
MSTEKHPSQEPPELHVSRKSPRCGKFVGKDGERDLHCDLPEGHADACSAPVEDVEL